MMNRSAKKTGSKAGALGILAVASGLTLSVFPGCGSTGIGDPCTPEQEYNVDFNGFDYKQVSVESKSFQCQTRLCLVNHFQGRVSCAYGQDATGAPLSGDKACNVPGTDSKVAGNQSDKNTLAAVQPQCTDRTSDKAVYCSCRCQNVDGKTDDGAVYCACPDGFKCTQLVASTGIGNEGLTGGYCVKNGTQYNASNVCASTCDANTHKCN
jgi:hypothetical protein